MKTHRDYLVLLAGVVLGILLIAGSAAAQVWEEWAARYNGPADTSDEATALAVDSDGNVYVTGFIMGIGTSWDYCTIKYDADGIRQWVDRYNGPGNDQDWAYSLAVDGAGNVFVTGRSKGIGTDFDFATIKYNTNGIRQWVARYNGPGNYRDAGTALKVDADGNVFVTGESYGSGTSFDYATVKYNAAGVQQWIARYSSSGNNYDHPTALALDEDRNVYVTGRAEGDSTCDDYATIKYNSEGIQQWVACFNGPENNDDQASALALDANGNVYVTGWSQESAPMYGYDYATIKYNAVGAQQWVSFYSGQGYYNYAEDLAVDADANVYVTGKCQPIINNTDYGTIKYDTDGVEQWVAHYNGPTNDLDEAVAIAMDAAGNIYVTGNSVYHVEPSYDWNYATIKYNAAGQEQWVALYDAPGVVSQEDAQDLAVEAVGNVYVTGASLLIGSWWDYATIKYSQPNISISIMPINPPIQIPPGGGSFDFNIDLTNTAQSPQTCDAWISVQLPGGSWYGPVLGPVNLTMPGQAILTRLRTQNIPGRAPAGTYTYRGYVGDYPAKWDSSSFTFEKLGSGTQDSGFGGWTNTGEAFDLAVVGARRASPLQPEEFGVATFPNPFNPMTAISYQLPADSPVSLRIYDLAGRIVAELVNGLRDAGVHQVTWDASGLPSGVYLYRLEAGARNLTGKMLLLK